MCFFKPFIRFEITDTGIGIDEESLQGIFEDFTRAKISSGRKFEGAGLGTAISKELVELMDGTIGVDSEPGKGSTFWFEIPFTASGQADFGNLNNHILLIAAEESASVIRPKLQSWDLDFDSVDSSAKAVSLLLRAAEQGNPYHSAIIDEAVLNDLNPDQFAQMIRAEKQLANLALILVNAPAGNSAARMSNPNFITTLKTLETRPLYNAIHAAQSVQFGDENVVSLVEHYGKKAGDRTLRILAAEDNSVNQQVLRGILNRVGHEVTIVDSGDKVIEAVSESFDDFDLLIVDKNMPEVSGIDVVKFVRFMDTSHSLPVIMLTADATPEAKIEAMESGIDAFLTKPVDAKMLLNKIAALTNQSPSVVKGQSNSEPVKILHGDNEQHELIDKRAFDELAGLGENPAFIEDLVYGFLRDGKRHVEKIKQSSVDDYPEFRESLHALKGSSTELGARELAKYCLVGEAFKPYQMGSDEVTEYASGIDDVFSGTEEMFVKILKEISYDNFRCIDEDQG